MLPKHPAHPFLPLATAACFGPASTAALPLHLPAAPCSRPCPSCTFCDLCRYYRHRVVFAVACTVRCGRLRTPFGNSLPCRRNTFGCSLLCRTNRFVCSSWHCGSFFQRDVLQELLSHSSAVPPIHAGDFFKSFLLSLSVSYGRIFPLQSLLVPIMSFDSFFPAFRRQ